MELIFRVLCDSYAVIVTHCNFDNNNNEKKNTFLMRIFSQVESFFLYKDMSSNFADVGIGNAFINLQQKAIMYQAFLHVPLLDGKPPVLL